MVTKLCDMVRTATVSSLAVNWALMSLLCYSRTLPMLSLRYSKEPGAILPHCCSYTVDAAHVFAGLCSNRRHTRILPRQQDTPVMQQHRPTLGALAKHLDPNDGKVLIIIGTLIKALATPSESVQRAVASCLAPLFALHAKDEAYLDETIKVMGPALCGCIHKLLGCLRPAPSQALCSVRFDRLGVAALRCYLPSAAWERAGAS